MPRPLRLLLLEDDPADAELTLRALAHGGFEVTHKRVDTEGDYQAALQRAAHPPAPEIILADYSLRQFNALRALQLLQASGLDIPFIVVTGALGEESAVECMRQGATDFLLKDRLGRLKAAVQHALDEKHLRDEKRAAEAALRASETRYRSLFDSVPVGLFRTSPDGRFVDANPALARLLGYPSPAALMALNVTHVFVDEAELAEWQRRITATGEARNYERHARRKDGVSIWVRTSTVQVNDAVGRVLYYDGVLEDITERKAAEAAEHDQRTLAEALRDTAAALASTLDFDDVLSRVLDNVGRVVPHDGSDVLLLDETQTHVTLHAAHTRGYVLADLTAVGDAQTLPLAGLPLLTLIHRTGQALAVPDTRRESEWADLPWGRWICSYVGAPLRAQGQTFGFLNLNSATPGFYTNLHAERLQAFADQAALALVNARLYLSIQQHVSELSTLYSASAQLLATGSDLPTLAQQIVRVVTREFSFTRATVLLLNDDGRELRLAAQSNSDAAALPIFSLPLNGPGLITAVARTGQTIYTPNVNADARYVMRNPDTQTELDIPLRSVERHSGAASRVIGVLNLESPIPDAYSPAAQRILAAFAESAGLVLDSALLLERLQTARRMAEEANQLKSEFLSNTSHELRTPLTAILGAVQLVLDPASRLSADDRNFLEEAHRAAQHLLTLVNDLLDIADLQAGRSEISREPVHLPSLLDEACAMARPWAQARALSLELEPVPVALTQVWADPHKVRQILRNLLSNAAKFTERGGITVRVTGSPAERCACIAVQDTGIGITPDKQSRVFEPFVQADGSSTRRHGGVGLGLSISRRLAEGMGGTLSLFSAGAGQGSTFTLTLALVETQSTSAEPHP